MFKDRIDAGKQLGKKLFKNYGNIDNGIVLALPRGGVVVGVQVAKILQLSLDIIVTRKIGAPFNPEYAVAAVSSHEMVLNPRENPDEEYLKKEIIKERLEIARRYQEYRGKKKESKLAGKIVILVDDGLATGLTMAVAVLEVKRQNPAKVIVAVPVSPPETIEKLKKDNVEIVVLKIEPLFFAVGSFYDFFNQVADDEVKNLIQKL